METCPDLQVIKSQQHLLDMMTRTARGPGCIFVQILSGDFPKSAPHTASLFIFLSPWKNEIQFCEKSREKVKMIRHRYIVSPSCRGRALELGVHLMVKAEIMLPPMGTLLRWRGQKPLLGKCRFVVMLQNGCGLVDQLLPLTLEDAEEFVCIKGCA